MKAITLHQPWAFCIAHKGKRIENRSWAPYPQLIGERIAIHAGKAWDTAGEDWLIGRGIIAVPPPERALVHSAIVCTAVIAGIVRESDSPWFAGPIGWVLRDVEVLARPVTCRGMQGLWTVPPHVVEEMASVGIVPALQLMASR